MEPDVEVTEANLPSDSDSDAMSDDSISDVKRNRVYKDTRSPEYKQYLKDLELNEAYDIKSTYGTRLHRGICLVAEEDLSHPKLKQLCTFAVEEHNRRCQMAGHGDLLLVRALKATYRITTSGTTYFITLEAKDQNHHSAIYRAVVYACEFGCMEIGYFGVPADAAETCIVEELRRRGKLTDEEVKRIQAFQLWQDNRDKEFGDLLRAHTRQHGYGRFVVNEVCKDRYVREKVCGHRRVYSFDEANQLMLTPPFHLVEHVGDSDLSNQYCGKSRIEILLGERAVINLKALNNSSSKKLKVNQKKRLGKGSRKKLSMASVSLSGNQSRNGRIESLPRARAAVNLKALKTPSTKNSNVNQNFGTVPRSLSTGYKNKLPIASVSLPDKKIEEILDQRDLITRNGKYTWFLVKWRGEHGSRLSWICRSEKEKYDLTMSQ